MPEWKKAGNIILAEPEAIKDYLEKDIAFVLIDLRAKEEAEKGFIKGAVSIPAKDLAGMKDAFPQDKSAPIVLYSDKIDTASFSIVRGWGYKDTVILNGGIEAWKKLGGALQSGPLATQITYVPKPRPGEISIEEFKAVAEQRPADKLIIDVRDEDEAMAGMLIGAKNIPEGKIEERLAEIPKDKEIIVHCVTGIRAESAYTKLKEKGYKVRFLNAVIQIDKDGKYEITKK